MPSSPTPDPTFAHRTADATLTVLGPDGAPLRDADVVVAQTRHAFGLGNIGFEFIPLANDELSDDGAPAGGRPALGEAEGTRLSRAQAQHLADLWLDVFNTATLPFYWGRFEPVRGRPDTARLRRTAEWFAERGVALKGHPLMWHTVQPDWLLDLPTDEVERLQRERIRREVGDFSGLIDTWDAINEVVIMPVFENGANGITPLARERGRIATIRLAFEEARATNPSATLLLNDFDMSTAYECLIEGVLEAGIQVDVLGLQSHMHQGYWGEEKTLAILDRFSRYGLPIHFTETTLLSGHLMPPELEDLNDYQIPHWPTTPDGEARQADEVERHYRTLASHPSVQGVTYWGLSDGDMWLGAPGGLVRADGTPKPSYDALRRLVKDEWWLAPTALRTDAQGRVGVRGWLGDYEVRAGGRAAAFTLEAGAAPEVTLG
ncbi:endo-1,4-beta-xylanase [Actinotalea sp. JY-7885]|uniref:endo-1,4-beta-xylanase n=1 Tax=Actinotalea sp. JY-7885 TaxID=2758576 RepID=UPI00165E0D99|nr:endo-1,4-beta-xylanase [Actinotalea sp. JY-7885]